MGIKLIYLTIIFIIECECLAAASFQVELGGNFRSNHVNQCNPKCARQDNGGFGYLVRLVEPFNFGVFEYNLINSLNEPARVTGFEPARVFINFDILEFSIAIWAMNIEGYYTEEGDPRKMEIIWPQFSGGVDLNYFLTLAGLPMGDKLLLKYNYINFILVSIEFYTLSYQIQF